MRLKSDSAKSAREGQLATQTSPSAASRDDVRADVPGKTPDPISEVSKKVTAPPSVTDSNGRSIAVPTRRVSKPYPRATDGAIKSQLPGFAAKRHDNLADDWETELVRDAQRLNVSGLRESSSRPKLKVDQGLEAKQDLTIQREEQRKKDNEWERSGMWASQQDAAREAEERTRRDAGRSIGVYSLRANSSLTIQLTRR